MMIVVMVVVSFLGRATPLGRMHFGFLVSKRITGRRRERTRSRHWNRGLFFLPLYNPNSTHPTELVALPIAVPADAADDRRGRVRHLLRRVVSRLFRVRFRSQPVCGFERRSQSLRTRLGTPHLRLHSTVQLFQFRVHWQIRGFGTSFVFVHESNHPLLGSF